MKRFISFALATLLALSALSVSVFADFGGGDGRGAGAGRRLETARKYYTSTAADSPFTYNAGDTELYSIVDSSTNTLNFLDQSVTYNNYEYNEVNNSFTFYTDNSLTYTVTENVTNVVVVYPTSVSDGSYETATLYYELPDGRNSFDLTASDVWGVYFNYNAVNYQQVVEDDGVTVGLWHFDESFADSSANQHGSIVSSLYDFVETPFNSGAVFNGDYTFYFPTFTPEGDFTFEMRVFVDPNVRSSINDENEVVDTVYFPLFSGWSISGFPAGSWCWVSITVSSGKIYIFVNGQPCSVYNSSIERLKNGDEISLSSFKFPIRGFTYQSSSDKYFYYGDVVYDEARLSNRALYTSSYVPSSQPFDTNLVFVLPDDGQSGDIAVKSNVPVADLRVGGVRPTYPSQGDVFVYLEDDVCKSVQQYQTDGWYSIDAAVFFDGEWVTAKAFDMSSFVSYEPVDPTPTPGPGECEHEYEVTDEKAATCTEKGSTTYTCKLCGDSYNEEIPALGHDWQLVETVSPASTSAVASTSSPDSSSSVSVPDSSEPPAASEAPEPTSPPVSEPSYSLYRCTRCGMEYKDYDGSGPPADEDEEGGVWGWLKKLLSTIVNGIVSILDSILGGVINLLVKLVDDLVAGVTHVIDSIFTAMTKLADFGGSFKGFLAQVFPFFPPEITVLLAFSISLSIILMIIKFFRG